MSCYLGSITGDRLLPKVVQVEDDARVRNRLDTTSLRISTSLTVPTSMEGVRSRRGHVGLGSRVVTYIRAHAMLQPCPHIRVKPPQYMGAVEKMHTGVHKVPGK